MIVENLTEDNFLKFAMASYTNIHCHGIGEFHEDLLLIKYIKRLFRKYNETGEFEQLRLRLALNHIIVFYNLFEVNAATRILFFKLEPEIHAILKTFLVFLNFMPAIIHGIAGNDIKSSDLKLINTIIKKLETA